MSGSNRDQQRYMTLSELGLLESDSIPIFEEATQTAAHFLNTPICILGLPDHERLIFKSAVGLSRIGLMNSLAMSRQLPIHETFATRVIESQQPLILSNASTQTPFSELLLVKQYGIRSYLGVPLLTSSGDCIGSLEVMDLDPRKFTSRDVGLLELIARWSMSEYERNSLVKKAGRSPDMHSQSLLAPVPEPDTKTVKADLITQMTQELRTPLTSILGMASVLNREIYGPLTDKQKEYLNIVHTSGQYLLTLVNEILELGALNDSSSSLNVSPIDIEMLCQQALSTLNQAAQRRDQTIRLTVEPGPRIWLLDKDKVRQLLYHLVFSVIQSSTTESVIRIHVSRKQSTLYITVWTSHPWLGDGLPTDELHSNHCLMTPDVGMMEELLSVSAVRALPKLADERSPQSTATVPSTDLTPSDTPVGTTRQGLGLMLSRQLAELHGGSITLQGSLETGYRYVINLPQMSGFEAE